MNPHSHNHHGGRSRRAPRPSAQHNSHKQFRAVRAKEVLEATNVLSFRRDFEAARSFDIEDDEAFCPFHLLTEDDLQSIHSSGSDRSSLSSGSPEQSPLQHQLQPTPTFMLSSMAGHSPSSFQGSSSQTKLHQPLAQRTRNAIPIVDPSTRSVASPPPSVSPARQMQQQYLGRRW
ncbi:hypothetical protein K402DRAFT_336000 [Aulographum hederae CBS 113979]|uniref:Uncharacterized protein n=1 Tax=Aulographum hederae CBS 113979 TaxID=1176131 RepID=A0A6G1GVE2_9PEZI|nr:hypothetical protein K402DRAFT_336000 [Aulographum hederae CBS 113979]